MALLEELKRRHVFQVGIAYLVLFWLLLQVVDVLAPMLALPDWAPRLILLLLATGFPVALLLAWALELTPQGIRRELAAADTSLPAKRPVFELLLFLGMLLGLSYLGWERLNREEAPATGAGSAAPVVVATRTATTADEATKVNATTGTSIAVLPFLNLSSDPEQSYFSDGIAEELLNLLTRVPGLRVASRTSAFAFKGANRNVPEIAAILKVDHILEGSVRKSGQRVRITVQLIDTANDRHVWSETFDRELTDIFSIQDEISNAIVNSLQDTLGIESVPISVVTGTDNMDAYELYLQARSLDAIFSTENRRQQVTLYEQAVIKDPTFAAGWRALAQSYAMLPSWDHSLDRSSYLEKAHEAIERSLELDPDNADVLMAKSMIAYEAHNWRVWRKSLDGARAIDANILDRSPDWVSAFADQHLGLGYLSKALETAERGLALLPDHSYLHLMKGLALISLQRQDEALEHVEQAIALGYAGSASGLVWGNFLPQSLQAAAWTAVTSDYLIDHDPELLPLLPHIKRITFAAEADRELEIRRFWRVARELGFGREEVLGPGPRFGTRLDSEALMALGEYQPIADRFFGNSPMFWMWSPGLRPFRHSEAFKNKIRETGMLAVWQNQGWPDLCRPLEGTDFICD